MNHKDTKNTKPLPAVLTWPGFRLGVAASFAFAPSVLVFASAAGAIAQQKGLTLGEAVLMSFMVFAGASQLVALQVWPDAFTFGGLFAVAGVTAIVNSRLFLMSASLRPWLGNLPPGPVYAQFQSLTDVNYIIAMRHRAEGGRDAGVLIGAGLAGWLTWTVGTIPGHLIGAGLADPRRWALDLVMPIFFAAMAVPLWRGHRETRAWLVAAAAALAVYALVPGHWYIAAGALAGMLYAAFDPFVEEGA